MYSITQLGKPLDNNLYTIDEVNKTFSSKEENLILDFSEEYGWIFKTGNNCKFKTGSSCTFYTLSNCTFNTGYTGTFNTGHTCTFKTGSDCKFKTGSDCTFKTGYNCTFKTLSDCTFIILNNAFIKCKDESPITILYDNNKINTLTIPNKIMNINEDIIIWENKDLILNCKDPNFKDPCNFFMKKDKN